METAIIGKILEMGAVVAILVYGYLQLKKDYTKVQEDYKIFVEKVMEENKNREDGYLRTINGLTDSLGVVNEINSTLEEVKIDITKLKEEAIREGK